ncbi:MAG: Glu-tRNA(Gln) amidotransferase subunit GatE [Candidatus Pacearchaeota archaeon]
MEKFDYEKLGLKAGLEIHQQLDTNKLFCSCPSILRSDKPLFRVKRRLNPVSGESGKIDEAVLHEKQKNLEFVYEFFDTNCLVELDEEPPHQINKEALKIALHIALLLNCKILPLTQIMRKTVIDGSNTSGFQRTVLLGYDGFVETSFGNIQIDFVFLEEDSARPGDNSENENSKTYKLDRLGIPLVEISTGPHLKTPTQIKETALKIGEILRACKVKRGIGTIRQDLNISIKGSKRVEIKGFQDPDVMETTVIKEIERQIKCIKEGNCRTEVRRANKDGTTSFLRPMPGEARMYPETDLPFLKITREFLEEAKKTLPELPREKIKFLKEQGLNEQLIKLISEDNVLEDYKYLINVLKNPKIVANCLCVYPREISVKEKIDLLNLKKKFSLEVLESILSQVGKTISENDVKIILTKIARGEKLEDALRKEKIDLKEEIEKIIKEKPSLSLNAYMGLIMSKFKGRVSGKEVMEELNNFLKEKNL